jgi:hypothetical protein
MEGFGVVYAVERILKDGSNFIKIRDIAVLIKK